MKGHAYNPIARYSWLLLFAALCWASCQDPEPEGDPRYEEVFVRNIGTRIGPKTASIVDDKYLVVTTREVQVSDLLVYDLVTEEVSWAEERADVNKGQYTMVCAPYVVTVSVRGDPIRIRIRDVNNPTESIILDNDDFFLSGDIMEGTYDPDSQRLLVSESRWVHFGHLWWIDLQSGEVIWQHIEGVDVGLDQRLSNPLYVSNSRGDSSYVLVKSAINYDDDRLSSHQLICQDSHWEERWSVSIAEGGRGVEQKSLAIVGDNIVVIAQDSLKGFSLLDGKQLWSRDLLMNNNHLVELRTLEDEIYLYGTKLERIDPTTGEAMWVVFGEFSDRIELSYSPTHIAVSSSTLVDRESGEELFISTGRSPSTSRFRYYANEDLWLRHVKHDSIIQAYRVF